MGYPVAIVVVALISAGCFLAWLFKQNIKEVDLSPIQSRLDTQELAIKNLAVQTLEEVSKLRDRMGTMALAVGMKPKEKQP